MSVYNYSIYQYPGSIGVVNRPRMSSVSAQQYERDHAAPLSGLCVCMYIVFSTSNRSFYPSTSSTPQCPCRSFIFPQRGRYEHNKLVWSQNYQYNRGTLVHGYEEKADLKRKFTPMPSYWIGQARHTHEKHRKKGREKKNVDALLLLALVLALTVTRNRLFASYPNRDAVWPLR